MSNFVQPRSVLDKVIQHWINHEFYRHAIVLGLDVGIEGIGIYLRRGTSEIYARTLMVDLPEAEALAARRAKRAWRHCRKNRATRQSRLKRLFTKHGLPWLNADQMSRARPFRERNRAITTGVASKEALSICIRHCVNHRGYDYGGTEEGSYPWGDSPLISKAKDWLATTHVTPGLAELLQTLAPQLEAKTQEEEQRSQFLVLIKDRETWSKENDISRVLAEHVKGGHDNLRTRARGHNFSREQVWQHLESIIRKHAHLVEDVEGFIAVLSRNPNKELSRRAAEKAQRSAIFHYNRKTRYDMEALWARKVNLCPFATQLGLENPNERCATNNDLEVRRWKVLEFATTRRVDIGITEGKGAEKRTRNQLHSLSAAAVEKLVRFVVEHATAQTKGSPADLPEWTAGKEIVLEDIRLALGAKAKPAPSSQSEWNKAYFDQLHDLLAPSLANRKKRASLSSASAALLFRTATDDERNYQPENIVKRLKALGFYDWRRNATSDFGVFPQVELLLGRRIKHGKARGNLPQPEQLQGFLRRLFVEHSVDLEGATAPDYCVVEVIGDAPRTKQQAKEIQTEQLKRRESRKERFAEHNLTDSGVASRRRRVSLWAQQKGICPYTGKALPQNPLDPALEIEHIFPAEMGGLSVDDNLVLTWRTVNGDKGKQIPVEFSTALGVPFAQMLSHSLDMRWGAKKREIFAWGSVKDDTEKSHFNPGGSLRVPDFGNTTRIAQLARQLRAEVAGWMGVENTPDEAARRIGTPSGWLSAQARKSWLTADVYSKVRSNLAHHLIDAAVLAHIPPREGMNSALCKGIFYVAYESVRNELTASASNRIVTKAIEELSPAARLKHWLPENGEYAVCPVVKHRSRSKMQTLGDSTFWRQVKSDGPKLAQRTPLNPEKVTDAEELYATLLAMGIDQKKIPSRHLLESWLIAAAPLNKEGKPLPLLKLTDGTPVKNLWKFDSKGSLTMPLGWSGKRGADGTLRELRVISLKYDRLEVWLGYDHELASKAKLNAEKARRKAAKAGESFDEMKLTQAELAGWTYQKRLIPDATSLRHLKQTGFKYDRDSRHSAPAFMQEHPERPATHKTLRQLIQGEPLCPFSKLVGAVRLGDEFSIGLLPDGSIRKRDQAGKPQPTAILSTFYSVSSLIYGKGNPLVELTGKLFKEKKGTILEQLPGDVLRKSASTADDIAFLLGLPEAAVAAKERNLRVPTQPLKPNKVVDGPQPQLGM